MNISIVGTGYVGLVSGVCLAEKGNNVICVDLDREKVDTINKGSTPIYERNLEELLKSNVGRTFRATTDLRQSVLDTDITLIAVGTPFDGSIIDLSYVKEATRQIGYALKDKTTYHLVVVKSTVVPGTTDDVVLPILEEASGKKAGDDFGVGMNPEFLREGEAVSDFMYPDRIVLGGMDDKSRNELAKIYGQFESIDKVRTNNKTAEMIKYTSNSLLATMISFSNEIGNLCSALGDIDVVDVMKGVHLDKRLSPVRDTGERITPSFTTYLEAGCGFGGSCFPKDVKALIAHGEHVGRPMRLLDAVIQINENQPALIIEMLRRKYPSFEGKRVAVLGLAFKPETDDMRESPAIPVVKELIKENASIKAYDPVAREEARKIFGNENITYCDNLQETVDNSEVIIIMTRWDEFREIPQMIKGNNPTPLVIDGRRMLDKSSIERYEGIGL